MEALTGDTRSKNAASHEVARDVIGLSLYNRRCAQGNISQTEQLQ